MRPQDIQELLHDLEAGRLAEDDSALLRDHLAQDPGLERFTRFVTWLEPRLTRLAAADHKTHPGGDMLVALALGPVPEFSEIDHVSVSRHVDTCAECRDLVALVRNANAAFDKSMQKNHFWNSSRALMALAATLMVILLGAGWFLGNRPSSTYPAPVRLAAVSRSEAAEPVITLYKDQMLPPLLLVFDPWVGRLTSDPYDLKVHLLAKNPDAGVVGTKVMNTRAWSAEAGGLMVTWDQRDLAPGYYQLEVEDDGGQVIFRTVFRLSLPAE